jgi:hypothetical protein
MLMDRGELRVFPPLTEATVQGNVYVPGCEIVTGAAIPSM